MARPFAACVRAQLGLLPGSATMGWSRTRASPKLTTIVSMWWPNTWDPFLLRQDIARIFKLPAERVRFHAGFVGGGFGAKSYCKIEPIAVLLARKAKRPVRLALTMAESMITVCEHGARIRLRCGVSESGETLVREAFVDLDGGAYADASPSVAMRVGTRMGMPDRWRAHRTLVRVIRTTTVPAGSFRGFGSGHVTWASESQVDDVARRMGDDPCAFRMRNFASLGTSFAPSENPFDSDLQRGLRARRCGMYRLRQAWTVRPRHRDRGGHERGGRAAHRADAMRADFRAAGARRDRYGRHRNWSGARGPL